jgi:hypothetical protein
VVCGSKNGHQKDICLNEIGLNAQNLLSILGYKNDIDLLINLHCLRVLYPTRSKCRAQSARLRPAYHKDSQLNMLQVVQLHHIQLTL